MMVVTGNDYSGAEDGCNDAGGSVDDRSGNCDMTK
jgi:hypothetical protein